MLLDVKEIKERENPETHEIEDTFIGIAASNGKMVNFHSVDIRPMGRSATGVKGIDLYEGEVVVGCTTSMEGSTILVLTDKSYGKMSDVADYRITQRGAKGVSTLKSSDKVGKLVAVRAVEGDEDLMVITNAGIVIRTHLNQIRVIGRNTQGVKVINLEGRQKVSSIAIVPFEEEVEEDEVLDEEVVDTNEVVSDGDVVVSTEENAEE